MLTSLAYNHNFSDWKVGENFRDGMYEEMDFIIEHNNILFTSLFMLNTGSKYIIIVCSELFQCFSIKWLKSFMTVYRTLYFIKVYLRI